jgi:hypothetical protein
MNRPENESAVSLEGCKGAKAAKIAKIAKGATRGFGALGSTNVAFPQETDTARAHYCTFV